jgi:CRISPR-associated protein Cas1
MQTEVIVAQRGVVVANGYGIKIHVHRRHLVVEDGVGRNRRVRRFHRATSKLKRLVVVGRTGYITLESLTWLRDVRAALVQMDADGRLLATSVVSGPTYAALRRAQALASAGPAGVSIARDLLITKVQGQRTLVAELPDAAGNLPRLDTALRELADGRDRATLLRVEAQAASAYWQAWSLVSVPFPAGALRHLPGHWLTFGQRASPVTGTPRTASNPPNAILNYLYALLEAEIILACHQVGLDPFLGIFHTDQRDRASLALDVMEGARPAVDAYVLALLTQRTLSPRDFIETRQGVCRISPRLAQSFAEFCPALRMEIAPLVERVAHALAEHATSPVPRLTPLTGSNWSSAWDLRKPDRRQRTKAGTTLQLAATCRDCGDELPTRRHRYCGDCRQRRWEEDAQRGRDRAARVLAVLRAEQRDPGHGGHAAELRGSKNAAHQRAIRAWVGDRPDPQLFSEEILPHLRRISLAKLVDATGLSRHYCSLIRLGKRTPHPRHWGALRAMITPDASQ